MTTQKILEILRAFKALLNNLPYLHGDGYVAALELLEESFIKMLPPMLETQYFLCGTDSDCDYYVSIFDNEADRDSFVKEMRKINDERREHGDVGEMCKPITFEEFLDFAKGELYDLNNYSLDEDGAIEFIPNSVEI